MTLGEKQRLFTQLIAKLIEFIYLHGYEATLGDAYRDPRLHGKIGEKQGYGHYKSCHKARLALDINLFLDGVYLPETIYHLPIGEVWESMHPLCRWGGRFKRPDGNHYSLDHNGNM